MMRNKTTMDNNVANKGKRNNGLRSFRTSRNMERYTWI